MWNLKTFKTFESMCNFIAKNKGRYIMSQVFIADGYAVEYKKLLKI